MTALQISPPAENSRLAWFQEAKFGLFIHWGVYAVPAGMYKGKEVTSGTGEWIMNYARIPVAEYREFARQFNPVQYDPAEWMALAKEAGMKYVVITAKHHDGFALYGSKVSDWNVVQATPYGKDLIGPLVEAARAGGLKVGLYYSHDLDWVHPGGGGCMMEKLPDGEYVRAGGKWDTAQEGDFDEYLRTVSVPQVRELLSLYQPDMIWWDYAQNITPERAKPFVELIQSCPQLISNNRLGGGFEGDLGTPEQHIPESRPQETSWEACMTMNETWGYKANDHAFKSTETLLHHLIDIASKGGNYLLNVGPDAMGVIPQPEVDRLTDIGKWLKVNGDAIYGSGPTPFAVTHADWRCTTKPGKLFIHLLTWPGTSFTLTHLPGNVTGAYLLADPKRTSLPVTQTGGTVIVTLPARAPNPFASVLCLTERVP